MYTYEYIILKGQSHEIFCTRFFPQTAPPGPIRDVLGPFRFFLLLGWVISILKWLPGVLWTGELRFPGVLCTGESKLPGVLCTGESQNLTCWKSKRVPSTGESRLPGALGTEEWRLPGVLGTGEWRLPGVLSTGESRLFSNLWVKTPRCPIYWGVAKPDPLKIQNSPNYQGVETPRCPMFWGVVFCFFEPSSPCCSL